MNIADIKPDKDLVSRFESMFHTNAIKAAFRPKKKEEKQEPASKITLPREHTQAYALLCYILEIYKNNPDIIELSAKDLKELIPATDTNSFKDTGCSNLNGAILQLKKRNILENNKVIEVTTNVYNYTYKLTDEAKEYFKNGLKRITIADYKQSIIKKVERPEDYGITLPKQGTVASRLLKSLLLIYKDRPDIDPMSLNDLRTLIPRGEFNSEVYKAPLSCGLNKLMQCNIVVHGHTVPVTVLRNTIKMANTYELSTNAKEYFKIIERTDKAEDIKEPVEDIEYISLKEDNQQEPVVNDVKQEFSVIKNIIHNIGNYLANI